MLSIQRAQVPVHEPKKPVYVAEMAIFTMGNQAMPMIFIGMSEEEIGTLIANKTKEISLATRNKVQATGPALVKEGPAPVPN